MPMTILYARVSTTEQTLDHQLTQAEQAGFAIGEVIEDHGVSGVNMKLVDRPGGKRLLDKLRAGDTLVVRWVDRLGRDYQDVTDTLRLLLRRGVIVKTVINGMVFDGTATDPMQEAVRDALIGFMAAMAQAQAEATKEAQRAGIASAQAREGKYLGKKPKYDRQAFELVTARLAAGEGVSAIARETGLPRQTVHRMKLDPLACAEALARWGM